MMRKLKGKMSEHNIKQFELAEVLRLSSASISNRMSGRHPFNIYEIYKICDILQIPYEQIPVYFPPEGRRTV